MRLLLLLLVFFQFNTAPGQPVEKYCNCYYPSYYPLKKYLDQADSIGKVFIKKDYKELIVIGFRGYSGANLMFVVTEKGKRKAYYYDLYKRKQGTYSGKKLVEFIKIIEGDSTYLQTVKPLTGFQAPSADYSYFISFDFPRRKFFEVCHSQLARPTRRASAIVIGTYLEWFSF